jgi:hypothetical protein
MGARNSFVPNVETYPYTIGNYMTSDELFGRSDRQEIGTRNGFVRPYNQDMMYVDNSLQRTGPTALNDMFGRRSSMPTMTNRQEMGSFHQGMTQVNNGLQRIGSSTPLNEMLDFLNNSALWRIKSVASDPNHSARNQGINHYNIQCLAGDPECPPPSLVLILIRA